MRWNDYDHCYRKWVFPSPMTTSRRGNPRTRPSSAIADGRVYFKIEEVRIELYTDRKDPAAESKVEAVLDQHGIFYARSEVWIESEKLYEVLYSFEMEGNNDAQEE